MLHFYLPVPRRSLELGDRLEALNENIDKKELYNLDAERHQISIEITNANITKEYNPDLVHKMAVYYDKWMILSKIMANNPNVYKFSKPLDISWSSMEYPFISTGSYKMTEKKSSLFVSQCKTYTHTCIRFETIMMGICLSLINLSEGINKMNRKEISKQNLYNAYNISKNIVFEEIQTWQLRKDYELPFESTIEGCRFIYEYELLIIQRAAIHKKLIKSIEEDYEHESTSNNQINGNEITMETLLLKNNKNKSPKKQKTIDIKDDTYIKLLYWNTSTCNVLSKQIESITNIENNGLYNMKIYLDEMKYESNIMLVYVAARYQHDLDKNDQAVLLLQTLQFKKSKKQQQQQEINNDQQVQQNNLLNMFSKLKTNVSSLYGANRDPMDDSHLYDNGNFNDFQFIDKNNLNILEDVSNIKISKWSNQYSYNQVADTDSNKQRPLVFINSSTRTIKISEKLFFKDLNSEELKFYQYIDDKQRLSYMKTLLPLCMSVD